MTNEPTADEQPKSETARKVVAPKRRYFEPHRDYVAETVKPATAKRGKKSKQHVTQEEGDG